MVPNKELYVNEKTNLVFDTGNPGEYIEINGCGVNKEAVTNEHGIAEVEVKPLTIGKIEAKIHKDNEVENIEFNVIYAKDFQEFLDECFDGNELVCDYKIIYTFYLKNKVIGNNWWKLNYEQRNAIAKLLIRNVIGEKIEWYSGGKDNCEGGSGEFGNAVCHDNAVARYMRFNGSLPEDSAVPDNVYYYIDKKDYSEAKCYAEESYSLPVYPAGVYTGGFGSLYPSHAICAFQIGEDIEDSNSWIFFQYGDHNITPGEWQMMFDPYTGVWTSVNVCEGFKFPKGETPTSSGAEFLKRMVNLPIDGNRNFREPQNVKVTVNTDPPSKIEFRSEGVGTIYKGNTPVTTEVSAGKSVTVGIWQGEDKTVPPIWTHFVFRACPDGMKVMRYSYAKNINESEVSFSYDFDCESREEDVIGDVCPAEMKVSVKLGEEEEEKTPPCGSYGDVDGDGYVTANDAQLVKDYTVGEVELSEEQKERADVNADGLVDIVDAMKINQYINGEIDDFPVCGAIISLIDVILSKSTVDVNETVTIDATFKNTGDAEGTVNWELTVGGSSLNSGSVTVPANSEKTIDAGSAQINTVGSYEICVNII